MMEEALLRFPHIGDQILYQLNNEDYTNCREISKTFKSFINNQKLLPVRIIEEYINFTGKWKTFVINFSIDIIYRTTRAIITRGLYNFYPLFEVQKRFFKGLFS